MHLWLNDIAKKGTLQCVGEGILGLAKPKRGGLAKREEQRSIEDK